MLVKVLALVLGTCAIVSTGLSLVKSEVWWVRINDFPRLQILVIGILAFVLYLYVKAPAFLDKTFLTILFASLIYQSIKIFPYTSVSKNEVIKVDGSPDK